jgi:hypothetical protein
MNLLLPKKYLSSSQIELWKKNPERYKSEYFLKGQKLKTRYLEFGSSIHKMIENKEHEEVLPGIPTYPQSELRLTCEIKGVPVLMYIDGNDPQNNEFGDYKTGKTPWTQTKLQKSDQMLLYATGIRKINGKKPDRCGLHWIETFDEGGSSSGFFRDDKRVNITGKHVTLYRQFDDRELDRMEEEVLKVALEISEAYKEFINEI